MPVSSCRYVFLAVMSEYQTTCAVLPEDGPMGTETCRSLMKF